MIKVRWAKLQRYCVYENISLYQNISLSEKPHGLIHPTRATHFPSTVIAGTEFLNFDVILD